MNHYIQYKEETEVVPFEANANDPHEIVTEVTENE
jgi:hypothetical protein